MNVLVGKTKGGSVLLKHFAKTALPILAYLFSGSAVSQAIWNIVPGWNMLGNYSSGPLNVGNFQSNQSNIKSIWTWNSATSKWSFYSPSLSSAELSAYAQSNSYEVLSSIAPKQGFWINATAAFTITSQWNVNPYTGPGGSQLEVSDLQLAWNLIGGTGKGLPSQFNQTVKSSLNSAGREISSMWAWDAVSSTWKFYSPRLEAQGATALDEYISIKGYKLFQTEVADPDALWINISEVKPRYTELFQQQPVLLPDLRATYDALCGDSVSVQNALALNLSNHKDGKKDFLFNLWCRLPDGTVTTAPTVNGTIAVIQKTDGTFADKTKELFGVDMIDLGGTAGEAVANDFNGDGFDDAVFPTVGEDGRYESPGYTGNNRLKAFLTSNGNGTYRTEYLGVPSYTSHVYVVDSENGEKRVVSARTAYGGASEVWKYANGWVKDGEYDWFGDRAVVFFAATKSSEGSTRMLQYSKPSAIELYTRDVQSHWSKQSTWSLPNAAFARVYNIPYTGESGLWAIASDEGRTYISSTFENGCEMKLTPSSAPIALMILNAYDITGKDITQPLHPADVFTLPITKIYAFSISGNQISSQRLTIRNELLSSLFFALKCGDMNNDGYDDIFIMPWGNRAVPSIYLNDRNGNFSLVDPAIFPLPSVAFEANSMLYTDIDGDGIRDIVYWPLTRLRGDPAKVQYEIYKGIRHLNPKDLKQ